MSEETRDEKKKTSTSFRLSEPAKDKLAALVRLYGSQTIALEVAIDRLYTQEIACKESDSDECEPED
jgi:hypothetical protein